MCQQRRRLCVWAVLDKSNAMNVMKAKANRGKKEQVAVKCINSRFTEAQDTGRMAVCPYD